ncbi:MAG: GNAT family N-acetyltransferase [Leptolyngbyaceae cyanobacterium bins.349]|nr:GNAT family N-acetyltransferase [Leptolyngbyaceae cyanobacterium bins.349]
MLKTQFDVNLTNDYGVAQLNLKPEDNRSSIFIEKIQSVAAILARAFVDDPMFEFIFPDDTTRLQTLMAFFRPFVADGINRGKVLLASANQGVCIWYPAEVCVFDDEFEAVINQAIAISTCFGGTESGLRCEHLANQVGAYEPSDPRCEVLWIALLPEARGQGLGGHLLQPALDTADAQGLGSYLVSSNVRNHSFYERHGFRKRDVIQISPGYFMTGMWRALSPTEN